MAKVTSMQSLPQWHKTLRAKQMHLVLKEEHLGKSARAKTKIPSWKIDVKHVGQVWQPLGKVIWGERLCKTVHTHNIISGNFPWEAFIWYQMDKFHLYDWETFIQTSCERKKTVFSTFPCVFPSECISGFFWGFFSGIGMKRFIPRNEIAQALAEAAEIMG